MGELIDRSDVQKEIAKAQITINADPCFKAIAEIVVSEMAKAVHKAVDSVPAVDAVPVIRCKDCKKYWDSGLGYGQCEKHGFDSVMPDDFCSYSEPASLIPGIICED